MKEARRSTFMSWFQLYDGDSSDENGPGAEHDVGAPSTFRSCRVVQIRP